MRYGSNRNDTVLLELLLELVDSGFGKPVYASDRLAPNTDFVSRFSRIIRFKLLTSFDGKRVVQTDRK